jgi:hypothetical protein
LSGKPFSRGRSRCLSPSSLAPLPFSPSNPSSLSIPRRLYHRGPCDGSYRFLPSETTTSRSLGTSSPRIVGCFYRLDCGRIACPRRSPNGYPSGGTAVRQSSPLPSTTPPTVAEAPMGRDHHGSVGITRMSLDRSILSIPEFPLVFIITIVPW